MNIFLDAARLKAYPGSFAALPDVKPATETGQQSGPWFSGQDLVFVQSFPNRGPTSGISTSIHLAFSEKIYLIPVSAPKIELSSHVDRRIGDPFNCTPDLLWRAFPVRLLREVLSNLLETGKEGDSTQQVEVVFVPVQSDWSVAHHM